MKKTQINNEQEYREYTFNICNNYNNNLKINDAFGLLLTYECYDSDENGNSIDEEGNIIPPDTPENIKLEDWVQKLQYPIILLEWIILEGDGGGVICVETVSIHEFR